MSNSWAWCILIGVPGAFAPMLFIDGPLSSWVAGGGIFGVMLYVYAVGLPWTLLPALTVAVLCVRLFQVIVAGVRR